MEVNPQIELAERYVMETGVSLFLTGKAGTGKTTFLRYITERLQKRFVVVAPTGVAAVNAGGVTIHSFFQLPFCPYLPDVPELVTEYQLPDQQKQLRKNKADIIRTLEVLIIDEISMVRADLLDAIDYTLRRYRRSQRPFGGVQLLMIGDVHQLPPVVTEEERPYMERVYPSPFFFYSKALQRVRYVTIELQRVYRQQDADFLRLLNHIRDNQFDEETLARLNSRVVTEKEAMKARQQAILLTTHNQQADAVNQRELEALKGKEYTLEAAVEGNFPETSSPTDIKLRVKVGARVMFVKNDSSGAHRYYNGKLGTVTDVEPDPDDKSELCIVVHDDDDDEVVVRRDRWENIKYELDAHDNQIKQRVDGTFTQYPLRLAWAVTIHKAQGLTFDHVVVDAAAAFAYGQVYVALSRCRTLEGLTLVSPIGSRCAFSNSDVLQFCQAQPQEEQVRNELDGYRAQYYYDVLNEFFDMSSIHHITSRLERLFVERLKNLYPRQVEQMQLQWQKVAMLQEVSDRFHTQMLRIAAAQRVPPEEDEYLKERVEKGVGYFVSQLAVLQKELLPLLSLDIENKEISLDYNELCTQLREALGLKLHCLVEAHRKGFAVATYQKAKVDYTLGRAARAIEESMSKKPEEETISHPELKQLLVEWRRQKAQKTGKPAYTVLQQKSLLAIAELMPRDPDALLGIPGVGKMKVKQFGAEILSIVADYVEANGLDYGRAKF